MSEDIIKPELKEKIQKKLRDVGENLPCPRCGRNNFVILDAYFLDILQDNVSNLKLSGKSVPYISKICSNCGFISNHSLGVLGFLKEIVDDEKKEKPNGGEKHE